MNSLTPPSTNPVPSDKDLAEQALPGHGIPSQDTNPAAQIRLDPQDAEREGNSVLMGGGVVVGATVGGAAAGATVNSEDSTSTDTLPTDAARGPI